MTIQISAGHGIGKALLEWWSGLHDDRASRAVVRRAATVTAVTLTAPYQRLYRRLLQVGWPKDAPEWQSDRLAAAIGLLSHLKTADTRSLPLAMSEGEKPVVSELRFRRLLESPDVEALFTGLRRGLPLIGSSADPLALASDVINWGDRVKKGWAYSYRWPDKSRQ